MRDDERRAKVTASAPGKIIVTGEHFVVHGAYAVAASISKRARVTVSDSGDGESSISARGQTSRMDSEDRLFSATRSVARRILSDFGKPEKTFNITVESSIPSGSGLGSSAAVSVATAAALLRYLGQPIENQKLYEIALDGERQVHGNPSGIDIQASIHGGMILFSRNSGAKPIHLDRNLRFLVVYSGRRRRSGELIAKVAQTKKEFPRFFDQLTRSASFFGLETANAATGGDLPYLGAIMNIMQASLSWIGASNRTIDNLIENFRIEDVYGAKITGAGGGGSVIALPKPEKAEVLLRFISNRYKDSFICTVPNDGLRMEEEREG